jgi:cell division protein FtsW
MDLAGKLFKGDRTVWIIFMTLCLVSLIEVYSATSTLVYKNTHFWVPIVRHATFLLMGFASVLLLHNIPSRYYSVFNLLLLFPASIIMLLITPYIGENINESHRFLSIMGISFQPSEFGKLACILFVAFMLSKQEHMKPYNIFWIVWVGVGITCYLIFPENLSTAFLLFAVCFLMMVVGRAPWKGMVGLVVALLLAAVLVVALVHYSPKIAAKCLPGRITTWVERMDDHFVDKGGNKFVITDDNYQVSHAKMAIARGGLLGKFPGRSVQRDFLPQAYSDFIYAIIIEEMGLIIGGFGVLMLYVSLMFRVAIIAGRCEKLFPKYLTLGCGLLIVIQAFINMAVAVNLVPVTGQPLPLISRGGTSTMLTCFYFGIILSVSRFSAGMGNEEEDEAENAETPVVAAASITIDEPVAGIQEVDEDETDK